MNINERLDPRERGKPLPPDEAIKLAVNRAISQLERSACGKCHYHDTQNPNPLSVQPPNTAALWYAKARFSHAAHRTTACASCHPANYTNVPRTLPESLDLPGIDNCQNCHGPLHTVSLDGKTEQRGGAPFGCVECHRYHHALGSLAVPSRRSVP